MKTLLITLALLAGVSLTGTEPLAIDRLQPTELALRLTADCRAVLSHRLGLQAVIAFIGTLPALFPAQTPEDPRLLRRGEKEVAWSTWQRFLDYLVALDAIERYHAPLLRLKGAAREDSFLIGYAAMLAQYRAALAFIARAERHPELHTVLNEPVPELGLPAGTYATLKFRYLNVMIATEFAAREVVLRTLSGSSLPALREAIREDAAYVLESGRGQGELLQLKNALQIIQDGAASAWLPVQTGVSEWMGDTKIHRQGRCLISPDQVNELQPKLQPGDVLLERREWFLSNVGLPGFWSHAALYIGTADERRAFFAEPGVQAWVTHQGVPDGDLNALLQARSPEAYEQSRTPQEEAHVVRIIEAMSEGVVFTTLEHSANCDSLAVLRPRLPKTEKALALVRAFHYVGRPYDFNFDFSTDAELVCTELVYKAYEPAAGTTGLNFPLLEMLGRKVTPANELAKQFDAQYETTDRQYDLVAFLDGQEREGNAVAASLDTFRSSWKRPKWHVLIPSPEPGI